LHVHAKVPFLVRGARRFADAHWQCGWHWNISNSAPMLGIALIALMAASSSAQVCNLTQSAAKAVRIAIGAMHLSPWQAHANI